ncbi:hypothetical protein RFI_11071 [Reticulomyxa filosa]|uniref:AraC effector-binding domain-containing protein n=1 Tax=Reticulomyxa filosa TaxID=46433 RepID=X6NK14_RETFI|nr:hypothetical protein RFI_11071 [Reticulomyxa filosa]|eukprot:ETO26064.1 hypothetical protein RFI_11071 [Reticulomyxa filosa]
MSTKKFQEITPYLTQENCKEAHDWYVKYCGAKVVRTSTPQWDPNDKRFLHSVVEFPNKAEVFMSDRFDFGKEAQKESGTKTLIKKQLEEVPFCMHLQFRTFDEANKFWNQATVEQSGAKVTMKFEAQFWGESYGKFHDPFGKLFKIFVGKYLYVPNSNQSKNLGFEWSVGSPLAESGKKRCLSDVAASDCHKTEDGSPSNKKAKVHHVSDAEKSRFIGVVDCNERVGLFREYKVGKSTGFDFGKAIKEGIESVESVATSNSLKSSCRGIVAVCPESPMEMAVVRCLPGIIFNKSEEELKKCEKPDSVIVKKIPAGKYLVYLHVGSYAGLPMKWGEVAGEFKKQGYVLAEGESCYEEYLNTPGEVPEEKLQTKIYRGIASDLCLGVTKSLEKNLSLQHTRSTLSNLSCKKAFICILFKENGKSLHFKIKFNELLKILRQICHEQWKIKKFQRPPMWLQL